MLETNIQHKLDELVERHLELSALLSSPDVIADQVQFRLLSKEYAQLEPLVETYGAFKVCMDDMAQCQEMLSDPELADLAKSDLEHSEDQAQTLLVKLKILLLPQDPDDQRNVFLEIRSGAGGDEAGIFVGDLFRMYSRYVEHKGWSVSVVHANPSEQGGYKELIAKITGSDVYAHLKFESGAHRVQRVPETESQGRVHTSACTVAVMPEVDEVEAQDIKSEDLRIDTFRASGAGGQHVNKTDSAIRITHLPSGVVVECQEERSQHKNRAKAMSLLQSKLFNIEQSKQLGEQAALRKSLVGTGDRSERIRTYNYPQGRVTDHRINLTLYKLTEILEGQLSLVIDPLRQAHQVEQLTAMGMDA